MKKFIYIGILVSLIVFFVKLPSMVKKITVNKLEKIIGRKVSSGEFGYNYIKNILSIDNLKIYEENKEDIFVDFDSFNVNIDIMPLFKRKFYIRELTLVGPKLSLKYNDGIANFDSILKKIASEKKIISEPEPKKNSYIQSIELEDVTIDNFTFYYNDRMVRGENKFTIKTPQILYENKKVTLNSTVDFYKSGQLNLNLEYKEDGTLRGKVETKEFLLDDKLYILKALYNLEKLDGKLDSNFDFNCNLLDNIYSLNGQFSLKDLDIVSTEFGNLLSMDNIQGKIENFKIMENKFFLKEIKTNKGVVDLKDIKKYISSISKNITEKQDISDRKDEISKYPIFNIEEFEILDYKIYDEKIDLEIEDLQIDDLGTLKGNSNLEFKGKFQGAKINFNGEIEKEKAIEREKDIDSIGIKGKVDIVSLELKDIDIFLEESLKLNGKLSFSSKFNYLKEDLKMDNIISLEKLSLEKDDISLKAENIKSNNTLSKDSKDYNIIGKIEGKDITFIDDENNFFFEGGNLDLTSKFNYLKDSLKMDNIISLEKLSLEKDNISLKAENIKSNNTISKDSKDYNIIGKIEGKDVTFIDDEINFFFEGGNLDLTLKFNYLKDSLKMDNIISLEKLSLEKEDIYLKAENIKSNNILSKDSKDYNIIGKIEGKDVTFIDDEINFFFEDGNIEVGKLSKNKIFLDKIILKKPWVKIKQIKNNSKKEVAIEDDPTNYKINNLEDGKKEKIQNPILFIKTIEVKDGRLDYIYSDLKYNLRNIIIDINDFTTEKNKNFNGEIKADLTGNGKFSFNFLSSLEKEEDFSPTSLNIDGRLDILNLNFLDFDQILSKNLPNKIDNGKLNYNSSFILNKGKIKGDNLILIKQIDIGEKTDIFSIIPLKLGVNILKDRENNLKIDLPISGDFNNPKFKISRIVLEGLKNILVRAVTSPANFILSTFNIGEKKDLFIEYEYLDSNFKVKGNDILEKVVEILESKEDINIVFTLFTDKEMEKKLLNAKLKEDMFFKRDTKNKILEEEINKIIQQRKEIIKKYFKDRNLEDRIKVEISDISRELPIASIELILKK